MSTLPLPPLQPPSTAAAPPFADADACNDWLTRQPLANAPQMQVLLTPALAQLNTWTMPARERFKVLELLRKTVVTIETENGKRHEYRPLPLSAAEQQAFDASCRLWRELALGYLRCLDDCAGGASDLATYAGRVAHRALSTLRLEQLARYRAGTALPGDWWRLAHATYACVERMQIGAELVGDKLLAETRESTPNGQYAMALLLHLSRPYELSRSQFGAAQRWLARWRELATIGTSAGGSARALLLDLDAERPPQAGAAGAQTPRWLLVEPVLGKIKSRLKALQDGESPEALKLGSGLAPEACIALLQFLHGALQNPPAAPLDADVPATPVAISSGVPDIYRLLGGAPVETPDEPNAISNRRLHEQIAIFGHARREPEPAEAAFVADSWRLAQQSGNDLVLLRPPGAGSTRVERRGLIALQADGRTAQLAVVRSLCMLEGGALQVAARLLATAPRPVVVGGHERGSNRALRQPGLFVAADAFGAPASVFVANGMSSRVGRLSVEAGESVGTPGATLDAGTNYERLRCN